MDPNYTKLVLYDYEQKRAKNSLSLALSNPAPAKLKNECIRVCTERFSRKDGRVLNSFFGEGDDQAAVLKAIKKCEIDKFRPLRKFLKRETESTDDKNVELLAWLIDFKDRPYDYTKNYNVGGLEASSAQVEENIGKEDNEATSIDATAPEEEQQEMDHTGAASIKPGPAEGQEEPEALGQMEGSNGEENRDGAANELDPSKASAGDAGSIAEPVDVLPMHSATPEQEARKPGSVFKRGLAVLAITLLAVAGFWIYRGGKKEPEPIPMGQALPANNACMRWTGDHYEQIACRGTTGDTLVEPLDPEKIRSFKKITRPDTITRQSKGSVWYVKINKGKEIEFYTSDGFHPIERQLRLKPVTDYIIEKHLHLAQAQNTGN